MARANFSNLWDQLLSEGTNTVTVDELETRTMATRNAVYLAVKYSIDRKRLFSPARGLYVLVPPEYRSAGVVPAAHFIDPMMNHLGVNYYLGFATAAAWWGSAHHASQEFQVIVSSRVPNRSIGNLRLRFVSRATFDNKSIRRVAGLSHVATILAELPDLDGGQLAVLAKKRARSDARRLGWLLSLVHYDIDLGPLRKVADPGQGQPALLSPKGPRSGEHDNYWNVLVNTIVAPDL
jgi:hypothetical protein